MSRKSKRRSLANKHQLEAVPCENYRRGRVCGELPTEVVPGGFYFCAACRDVVAAIARDAAKYDAKYGQPRRPNVSRRIV